MADKKNKIEDKIKDLERKSDLLTGRNHDLKQDDLDIQNIINTSVSNVIFKYGDQIDGKVISYKTDTNFTKIYSDLIKATKDSNDKSKTPDLKDLLQKTMQDANSLLLNDSERNMLYRNYRAIHSHIPEAAHALEIIKDNVLSPDDFSKLIFNVKYDEADEDLKEIVLGRVDDIKEKYKLEENTDQIVEKTLMLGEHYVAVLSLEDELNKMLSTPGSYYGKSLNESLMRELDDNYTDVKITSLDVADYSDEVKDIFKQILNIEEPDFSDTKSSRVKLNEAKKFNENLNEQIAEMLENNIVIGSKKEFLLERLEVEINQFQNKSVDVIDLPSVNKKNRGKKKNDEKPLYINGSSIRQLDAEKMVELAVDGVVYGYYYIEENMNNVATSQFIGAQSGREVHQATNIMGNVIGGSYETYTPANGIGQRLGLSDYKMQLLSSVFINAIGKKIDKEFIRNNKQFKDFIFNLVKQDYIINKQIKVTYFTPDEVVKFQVPAVYRKVLFFAKLYIAMLTNNMLIKLGRAHDKRVYYVNIGLDAAEDEAINRVIQDVKTKDYKMEHLADINTILQLSPGRFDDIFIPVINGDKPIDIDTLPGMDVDLNNEFIEYLRQSILSGIGVPQSLIDSRLEVDFARTLSAQNGNLVRNIIKLQKLLTPSFNKFMRILYQNEFRFTNNSKSKTEQTMIDVNKIQVKFPSPTTLNFTNILDQLGSAEQLATTLTQTLVDDGDVKDVDVETVIRITKAKLIKDLVPTEWEKYKDLFEKAKLDAKLHQIKPDEESPDGLDFGY